MIRIEGNFIYSLTTSSVVTIGVFDGVHLGHQEILKRLRAVKRQLKVSSIIVTFHPHPDKVLNIDKKICNLLPLEEKMRFFEQFDVDYCWIIETNKAFLALNPETFIREYIFHPLKPQRLIVGENFRFGEGGKADIITLIELGKKYRFAVDLIPLKKIDGIAVSSNLIRTYIAKGDILKAKKLLGHEIIIQGRVIKGEARGRLMGFPTANLVLEHEFDLSSGVYVIRSYIDARPYYGLLYVGTAPTFKGEKIRYEVYIMNFSDNLYGHQLKLEILSFLREERFFSCREELVMQLQYDKNNLIKYLSFQQRQSTSSLTK